MTAGGRTWSPSDSSCQAVTIAAAPTGNPGTIRVVLKTVEGHGTFTYASNFGVTSLSTPGNGFMQEVDVASGGAYAISQAVPEGWSLTGASCTNGTPAAVVVMPGRTTTCTFTNRYVGPKSERPVK
jgi:hypothetical protein